MQRGSRPAGAAVLGVVLVVGAVIAILAVGTGAAGFGSLLGEQRHPPSLVAFDSEGVVCADDFMVNSSTTVVADGPNTEVTYVRNVSLPSPSHAIGGPTFERVNDSTYVLSIPFEETDTTPRSCAGVARYNATVRMPTGDDPWQLLVEHDGERATRIYGDSNSSMFGGSASVGQSVGAEPPENATDEAG